MKKSAQDVFISDPIDTDREGNAITLMDIIADETNIVEDIDKQMKLKLLNTYLNDALTPRERIIIRLRYGIGYKKEYTQREVAKKLDISRSYVSRIEKKALEKLRDKFE